MARKRLLTLMLSAIFLLCFVGSALAAGPARRYVGSSTAKGAIYQSSYRVDGHATITPPGLRIATVLLRLETSIPTAVISIDFIFPASFLCLFRLMPITDSACFVTRMYSDKSHR